MRWTIFGGDDFFRDIVPVDEARDERQHAMHGTMSDAQLNGSWPTKLEAILYAEATLRCDKRAIAKELNRLGALRRREERKALLA